MAESINQGHINHSHLTNVPAWSNTDIVLQRCEGPHRAQKELDKLRTILRNRTTHTQYHMGDLKAAAFKKALLFICAPRWTDAKHRSSCLPSLKLSSDQASGSASAPVVSAAFAASSAKSGVKLLLFLSGLASASATRSDCSFAIASSAAS